MTSQSLPASVVSEPTAADPGGAGRRHQGSLKKDDAVAAEFGGELQAATGCCHAGDPDANVGVPGIGALHDGYLVLRHTHQLGHLTWVRPSRVRSSEGLTQLTDFVPCNAYALYLAISDESYETLVLATGCTYYLPGARPDNTTKLTIVDCHSTLTRTRDAGSYSLLTVDDCQYQCRLVK